MAACNPWGYTLPAKPSYIGVLNAIAVGEDRGYALLSAWGERTPDPSLKSALAIVAIREREHAAVFAKRLCELGFQVRETNPVRFAEQLQHLRSDADDRTKFELLLGYGTDTHTPKDTANTKEAKDAKDADPLPDLFKDTSIDPVTGALLGRFIAEERDSGRLLRAEYDRLCNGADSEEPSLEDIRVRLDKLTRTIEELKSLK